MQKEKNRRLSCYYLFESAVQRYPDVVAIWSREGVYTWRETQDRACQYAAYFLELGVQPGDLVAFYLENSAELLFAWLGLWAIGMLWPNLTLANGLRFYAGCAPAMVNANIAGDTLIHSLKVSGARVLLVDENRKCRARINAESQRIENELEMKIIELSGRLKKDIATREAARVDDVYRESITGNSPVALFYTRYTPSFKIMRSNILHLLFTPYLTFPFTLTHVTASNWIAVQWHNRTSEKRPVCHISILSRNFCSLPSTAE